MNVHRSIGDNGLGSIKFRTQSQDDQAFRMAITPRKGQWLEVKNLSETEFEIVVRYKDDGDEEGEDASPQATLAAKSKNALLDQAAKLGVDVSPKNSKLEIMQAIREKQDAAE